MPCHAMVTDPHKMESKWLQDILGLHFSKNSQYKVLKSIYQEHYLY